MIPAITRLEAALAEIAARNGVLNLVTALDETGARAAAIASDARRATGQTLGPLDGVIIGIKDNIAVAGLPWTAGLAGWRDRIAKADALVVLQLRSAGAIILGTLNMHEAALGATTDNPGFGRACNPLDPARTPGGSSGGSGGAVAAGFVEAALGTDTLGSVRIPAAYCGVAGLKTTADAVPLDGLVFLSPSFDTIGPLARDAAGLAPLYRSMRRDGLPEVPLPAITQLHVGVPDQIAEVDLEPDVAAAFQYAQQVFAQHGARVQQVDLAGWSPGPARRGALLIVEAEAAVELAELRANPSGMSAALRGLLDYGAGLSSARMVDALARVRRARLAARRALTQVDVLLMPTSPQRAFAHEAPVPDNQADLTGLANMAGVPALSLPVARVSGLPASVQILGPDWSETALLTLGDAIGRDLM